MKESAYQLGIEVYKGRIEKAQQQLEQTTSDYDKLTLTEKIEELELKIKQNERRMNHE